MRRRKCRPRVSTSNFCLLVTHAAYRCQALHSWMLGSALTMACLGCGMSSLPRSPSCFRTTRASTSRRYSSSRKRSACVCSTNSFASQRRRGSPSSGRRKRPQLRQLGRNVSPTTSLRSLSCQAKSPCIAYMFNGPPSEQWRDFRRIPPVHSPNGPARLTERGGKGGAVESRTAVSG